MASGHRSHGLGCGVALLVVAAAFAAGGVAVLGLKGEIRETIDGVGPGRLIDDPEERQAVLRSVSWTLFLFALLFAGGGLSNVMTLRGGTWDLSDPATRRRVVGSMAVVAVLYGAMLVVAQLHWPQTPLGFVVHSLFAIGAGSGAYRLHRRRGA